VSRLRPPLIRRAKSTDPDKMKNYLGFFVYDKDRNQIENGDWQNPYFFNQEATVVQFSQWSRLTGTLLASRISVPLDHEANGAKVASSGQYNNINYVMPQTAAYAMLRYGPAYGGGEGDGSIYYAKPSVYPIYTGISQHWQLEESRIASAEMNVHANLIEGADLVNTAAFGWIVAVSGDLVRTPWNDDRMVWAVEAKYKESTNTCYTHGRATTHMIPIDPNENYEMGIWIKSSGLDTRNYVGFWLYDEAKEKILGDAEEFLNPYWKTEDGDGDKFTYHNGRIMASDTTSHARSKPFMYSDGTTAKADWVMPSQTRYIAVRWQTCYYGEGEPGVTHFAFPSFRRLGGAGFSAQGPSSTPFGVTYLGKYDITPATTGGVTQQLGPSKWTSIAARKGIGFSFYADYAGYYNPDTHDLVARVCLAFSDDLTNRESTTVRIGRTSCDANEGGTCSGGPGNTGNGKLTDPESNLNPNQYDQAHTFWEETFTGTFSNAQLMHHKCGEWFKASELSCGYSWTNACVMAAKSSASTNILYESIHLDVGIQVV
jgi:hypothetical protein